MGLFLIGLCYSVRSSAAYVFTSEGLLTSQKLKFCVYQFACDGMMVCCMSILYFVGFMTWRLMMLLNMFGTFYLIWFLAFRLHESPQYLYSKDNFDKLRSCLENIAKRNGIQNCDLKVARITEQL